MPQMPSGSLTNTINSAETTSKVSSSFYSWDEAIGEFLTWYEAHRAEKTVRFYRIQLRQLTIAFRFSGEPSIMPLCQFVLSIFASVLLTPWPRA